MKKIYFTFIFLCVIIKNDFAQGCSFNISYTGFPASAETAFNYAAQLWTYELQSAIPIKINATYISYPTGPLAITFSNGRKDFIGAPLDSTWYPTSLANAIASTELNIGEVDMDIYVNGAYSWYFGTDGLTPAGQYDFVSVVLHEMGHGLGFTSLTKKDSTTGSIGFLQMSDFAPVVTSFPWPNLDSLPGVFDRFIENNSGTDLVTYTNPSSALGSQLTSGQLYFNGTNTLTATGGTRARLHAPGSFSLGTSILHLNESTYPVGNAEELMTPYISTGNSHHYVGPMTLGMLQDIGWILYVGLDETNYQNPTWKAWPNPADENIQLFQLGNSEKQISLISLTGEVLFFEQSNAHQMILNTTNFINGFYFIKITDENHTGIKKIIISH